MEGQLPKAECDRASDRKKEIDAEIENLSKRPFGESSTQNLKKIQELAAEKGRFLTGCLAASSEKSMANYLVNQWMMEAKSIVNNNQRFVDALDGVCGASRTIIENYK
ncbi:MAG: hypothetical protein WCJ64_27270 [Rhodospirillaceae bacterium]